MQLGEDEIRRQSLISMTYREDQNSNIRSIHRKVSGLASFVTRLDRIVKFFKYIWSHILLVTIFRDEEIREKRRKRWRKTRKNDIISLNFESKRKKYNHQKQTAPRTRQFKPPLV